MKYEIEKQINKKNDIKNALDQFELTCQTHNLNHKTRIISYKPNQTKKNNSGQSSYLTKPATWVMKLRYPYKTSQDKL